MRGLGLIAAACVGLGSAALAKDITGTPEDDLIRGTEAADRIQGLAGRDELFGFDGDDVLDGGPGNDELFGGHGADQLIGGEGDDFLDGREGDDLLSGGSGRDVFAYYGDVENGSDVITDFDAAEDRIALSDIEPAEVVVTAEGPDTVVELPGGDQIRRQNVSGLTASEVYVSLGEVIR